MSAGDVLRAAPRAWRATGPRALALVLAVSAAAGYALLVAPPLVVGAVGLVLLATVALQLEARMPRAFLSALGMVLLLYAFLGKGAAYIGVPPVFIGEIVLLWGLLAVVLAGGLRPVMRSPIAWLIVANMVWGAACTLPYVGRYGLASLRDAVVWGYGIYALVVAACLLRTGWLARIPDVYRRVVPWYVLWVPIAAVLWYSSRSLIPNLPGTGVGVLRFKGGDMQVHLAGIAAFLLLGLYTGADRSRGWRDWLLWPAWLLGFLLAALQNRGGMLAVFAAVGAVMLLRPSSRWGRALLVVVIFVSATLVADVEIDYGGHRPFSTRQLATNIESVFVDQVEERRLSWWSEIVDYTVFGPHFWTGKGYGINLAEDDGFGRQGEGLRSPHNGHLTVLARSGVPGAALWLLLQLAFGVAMIRAYRSALRGGLEAWARLDLWILAYWLAFLTNAAFDVFLEGPPGGIWFWSLIGAGLAAMETQRRILARPRRSAPERAQAVAYP